ncbi:MAG: mechanosensitive ion channel [Pirellulales bacterium]|nr:mechanosensitive ion channel [Pirellulales bacterium]
MKESANDESSPTRQQIEEHLKTVKNAQQLEETAKADLLKRYKAALDWITASEEALEKTTQYQADITGALESVAKVKAQLATAVPDFSKTPPAETTLRKMEQDLSQAELQLKEAEAELAKREQELKVRGERKAELAKLIDDSKQRLDAAKKQLASPPGNGESPELVSARRIELAAHMTALEHQLKRYQVEIRRYDALVELMPLQRDLARREKNMREKQVAALQLAVAAKRKSESERQAEEAKRAVANSHPALHELAKRNATLAEEHKKLAESLTKTANEVIVTGKTLAELEADFKKIQEKVHYAGNSTSIGLILRTKRSELPDTDKCEQRISFVSRVMPEANLERMERQEERTALGDLDTAAANAVDDLDGSFADADGQYYLREAAKELLEKKRDLLDKLINTHDQYLTELSELEISNRKLVAKIEEVTSYVEERVLWVRSAEILAPNSVADTAKGLMSLARPSSWIELSKLCGVGVIRQPRIIFLVIAVFGILIALQTHLRKRMRNVCTVSSGGASLKIWPTLEGLLIVVAISAPLPLLLILAGWWMARTGGTSDLGQAVGYGLRYSALLLWVVKFTRLLCRPGHLAESHFGWSEYSLAIARRHLRWLTYGGLPLVFLVIFAGRYQDREWENSLGRIAFIIAMLLLAAFMHAVFFAKNNVLREMLSRKPDHWLIRFRFGFYILVIGLPSSLALLAAIGYYYSAQQLALRLETTLALVLGLVLLQAVVSRWFLVKRRNLALAHMKERQAGESENIQNNSLAVPVADAQEELSLIHQRLNYLLYNAVAVCFLVGSWMIWADVLPALKVLDKQTIWYSTVEVVETQKDASGNQIPKSISTVVPTTARHALLAGLILVATFVIGRHLPALLEIALLGRLRFDKGGRHAISVLLRYLVALVGVFMACHTMSITWSSVQWLAAGMTVGLGFGLQEVFANFISGLILLFERPIRVGDVITLGDTTGTVTDIRIRATTVRNWDRKELIVPNKELITGRLLNWTLSDPVNRIVISVGVAYKSDTRKARELMIAIATDHPNVLEDPEPRVTFESFGDSTLNFVLRCYIASMDIRLDTIHELHEAVHDRFNQEGVEIAFPQMDLHIRSVEQQMPLSINTSNRRGDAA